MLAAQSTSQLTFRGTTVLTIGSTSDTATAVGPETHVRPEFDARFERLAKRRIRADRRRQRHVAISLAALDYAPEDGFTGYPFFGGSRAARWGDYSAAVADADGSIWFANEYISNSPRTVLANWGTFIGHIFP